MKHRTLFACGLTWVAGVAAATAQNEIDGITFVDRRQTGEILLGAFRGGIAVIDYDLDGFMDLVIGDTVGKPHRLFHNVEDANRPGARTWADVTAGSGIDDADGVGRYAIGCLAADYDNDGDADVLILGRNATNEPRSMGLLYRNDGGGHFTNVSVPAGVRVSGGQVECGAWADYDLDGRLDLVMCGNIAPFIVVLHNNGDGTFANVSSSVLPSLAGFGHVYSCMWMDYDRDGYPDLFTITSTGPGFDVVLHNVADGAGGRRFENVAQHIGFVDLGTAPMGIAAGDYDGDGDLDLGISDAIVGTYFRNDVNTAGKFTPVTPFATMFGWGVAWLDVDNDGDVDFYTAGSWTGTNVDNLQRNLGDGAFQNISAVLNTASLATQFSVQLDLNNDGRRDILAVNPNASVSVYENASTPAGHFLTLRLRGDGVRVNRDAVGAFVTLTAGGKPQVRELVNGSSTTATEDLRLHFGLGSADTVERIEIIWPHRGSIASRTQVVEGPIPADQVFEVTYVAPDRLAGDANCDGSVNGMDIQAFVLALGDPGQYALQYPGCDIASADVNQDGSVNGLDIDPFAQLLGP